MKKFKNLLELEGVEMINREGQFSIKGGCCGCSCGPIVVSEGEDEVEK